ncbi:hypothetical protein [Massilia sp. BJB1822]|uniref:hypothetical protein n=1 Tax=Massilia sp. BJB1822 TaxID=2744470 RepID=UPI001E3C6211|nr:hypothetical protein [Massilia sp. BJB1822]
MKKLTLARMPSALSLLLPLGAAWLAAVPLAGLAAEVPAAAARLAPLAFLAGHCWRGDMPGGKANDTHCFEWLYGGHYLRDRHVVRAPGRPDYEGETLYFYDHGRQQIAYIYYENAGGIGRGLALGEGERLVFPEAEFVSASGSKLVYRATWQRIGDAAYEASNEIKRDGQWHSEFKMRLNKVAP